MSAKKTPLARTKEEHGSKEKLVDRLVSMLGQISKQGEKDDLKAKLLAASNKKLLRLLEVAG